MLHENFATNLYISYAVVFNFKGFKVRIQFYKVTSSKIVFFLFVLECRYCYLSAKLKLMYLFLIQNAKTIYFLLQNFN